jgi:hypothetical protein
LSTNISQAWSRPIWISKPRQNGQNSSKNSFLAELKKIIRSNSISTLSIIKDSLIKQGTLKSKHLNIKRDIQPGSLHSVLAVIGQYFQESNTIKNEYEMLAALREIKDSPGGFDALSEK